MVDFNTIWETLVKDIGALAKAQLPGFLKQAETDGKAFLDRSKVQLQKWVQQVADGTLTKEEFEFLVKGLQDLAEMNALKQAGLALVKIDNFKSAVINTVITTVLKFL